MIMMSGSRCNHNSVDNSIFQGSGVLCVCVCVCVCVAGGWCLRLFCVIKDFKALKVMKKKMPYVHSGEISELQA